MAGTTDMTSLVKYDNPASQQIGGWRNEIDAFLTSMQDWEHSDPDTVLREIAGIGARLVEIRTQLVRSESRSFQSFRTKELDPLMDQLEFQFKIHSRRHSVEKFDWDVSRGGT